MTTREAEFLRRLRATFLVEAGEHLQVIAASLLALEKADASTARADALETTFRHTHSLKGAARAAAFPVIESVCQVAEEVFALCKRRGRILVAADFDVLHRAFDVVGRLIEAKEAEPGAALRQAAQSVTAELQVVAGGGRAEVEAVRMTTAPTSAAIDATPATGEAVAPAPADPAAADAGAPTTQALPPVPQETIRVTAAQLDRILGAAEELLSVKQAAREREDELSKLEHHLSEWNSRWLATQSALRQLRAAAHATSEGPSAAPGPPEKVVEFAEWTFGLIRSLEGRLRAASRAGARDRHLAAKQIDELLDESKGLLMLPFATITEVIPRIVRDLARDQGKTVELDVVGGDVRLDKRILDHLKDPLIHLVRNAIDHGVEPPDARGARGKPPVARLRVGARQLESGLVEIAVSDDGAGFDPQALRRAAMNSGALTAEAAQALSDADAIDLAFSSDVSTSPIITEISGRGLGLAIVREQTEKLGGRVSARNGIPHGAIFTVTLPQALATVRGVFVEDCGHLFAIPSSHVERVLRCRKEDVRTISGRDTIRVDDATVSLAQLGEVLGLAPQGRPGTPSPYLTVVLVGGGRDRIALAIEDVVDEEEMLVKPFQRPLVRLRNVAGATVLASGKVVPVLKVGDLLRSARSLRPGFARAPVPSAGAESIAKKVLVAEDSITSRMLLKGILEAAGCEVTTAADGIEAFTALRSEHYDLLVSDVEMPRLNGFDLTARVRADPALMDLPVVLVTALASREDRERGIDVGANAYITKASFDQGDLLAAVRRLAGLRGRP